MGLSLSRALRLKPFSRIAFVGSGGKTTALFLLARQIKPVIVTASTHLSISQIKLADQHFVINSLEDCDQIEDHLPAGVILVTGPIMGDRTAGLSAEIFSWLDKYCDRHSLPMLIEADGSRQRPLKAPSDYEPVFPECVNHVVVVAGLSGFGKPLTQKWVHRPEFFASLSGLSPGELINPDDVVRVLLHPDGGIRNIPDNVRRDLIFNQADSPVQQALVGRLARNMLSTYNSVISTSVAQEKTYATHVSTAGIILAAGESKRYGEPKQMLDWRGKPLIWHTTNSALESGLSRVMVVAGADVQQINNALTGMPVEILHNPDWRSGQSSSVRVGLNALKRQTGAAIFLLCDQPQIPHTLIRSLVQHHAQSVSPIVAPLIDGQRGNPVLFDCSLFSDLMLLKGDAGGRQLFSRFPIFWLPWYDDRLNLDVDNLKDYQRLLRM